MNLLLKISLGLTLIFSQSISFAEDSERPLIGWVGLWNDAMIDWVENRNRLSSLCPSKLSEEDLSKCKTKNLSEKTWTIHTYARPNANSKQLGNIIIKVKPGNPFRSFLKHQKGAPVEFTTDLYLHDWGYGPYFHQTMLAQKGNWIKIALPHSSSSAWINTNKDIQSLNIQKIQTGLVYRFKKDNIVITKINSHKLYYRLEEKADMWCQDGEPPKAAPKEIKVMNINELLSEGRLGLQLVYMKGC